MTKKPFNLRQIFVVTCSIFVRCKSLWWFVSLAVWGVVYLSKAAVNGGGVIWGSNGYVFKFGRCGGNFTKTIRGWPHLHPCEHTKHSLMYKFVHRNGPCRQPNILMSGSIYFLPTKHGWLHGVGLPETSLHYPSVSAITPGFWRR